MVKLKCVLLDAGPVIALHSAGIWEDFCRRHEVVVSETIADDEALWHSRDPVTGTRAAIRLRNDEAAGLLTIEAANTSELLALSGRFDDAFMNGLHEGEIEALALLAERESFDETIFCAGDGAAIQAAVMIGLDERCVSLERLLRSAGLSKPLEWQFSERFHECHRREGLNNRISGLGLRR